MRFFVGFFGVCFFVVVVVVFLDMFDNCMCGMVIIVFSMIVFIGFMLVLFIGGFMVEDESIGWRWMVYFIVIMGVVVFIIDLIFFEEIYFFVILVSKVVELRRRIFNWGIYVK